MNIEELQAIITIVQTLGDAGKDAFVLYMAHKFYDTTIGGLIGGGIAYGAFRLIGSLK